jgi:hypothetical protein
MPPGSGYQNNWQHGYADFFFLGSGYASLCTAFNTITMSDVIEHQRSAQAFL